jgi:3'-phosphoadenosine 5'-phosphosulfate sulfotransferase (PAPS reductase)/FAD synthetase
MMRDQQRTADVYYIEDGKTVLLPTTKGKYSTQWKFPAQSADLQKRWCSSAAKADPARRALNNNPRLSGSLLRPKKILFITGERRTEGGNRAHYLKEEKHLSTTRKRRVDHWRPVIDESKEAMFELHREFGIMPHPVYYLGFGRVSCMGCVFSTKNQWAALEHIAKERVERFAAAEQEIQHTIDVKTDGHGKVAKGAMEKVLPMDDPMLPRWIEMSLSKTFTVEDLLMVEWIKPLGASRGCDGGAL